jgi:hypothetical protein
MGFSWGFLGGFLTLFLVLLVFPVVFALEAVFLGRTACCYVLLARERHEPMKDERGLRLKLAEPFFLLPYPMDLLIVSDVPKCGFV